MRYMVRLALLLATALSLGAPATAQVLQNPTNDGPCICTPIVGNYPPTQAQTWWVQARGGNLSLTLFARAVNTTDPGSVTANAFDSFGANVGFATIAYPAGQPIGTEFSSPFPVIAAAPGALYRIEVTTPGAPATQTHWRLKAQGADWIATDSPAAPGFEEGHVRWKFNVGAGEPLDVVVSTAGTPATASTLTYQWIDPAGVPQPIATANIPDQATPATLSIAAPAAGWWVLDLDSTEHYVLDKTGGADRRMYLDWYSAGEATLDGTVTLNGVPNITPIDLEVRDAHTGRLVAAAAGVTAVIPPFKLISGDYLVHVIVPPGINPVADIPVHLECDQLLSIVIALTGDKNPPPPQNYPLSVFRTGTGTGTVTSAPAGIFCGAACGANFASGTVVALTAVADPGSTFAGWTGDCTGTGACTVLMDRARSVTATFTRDEQPKTWHLNVVRSGGGTVTSAPVGIFCGSACNAPYADGTVVTVTATADPGWTFAGWGVDCSGTASMCTVTMTADHTVSATFVQDPPPADYTLTVTRIGSGTVTSAPAGIYCGASCSATYVDGTVVTLTATPASGWTFAGWTGACTGSASTCAVTMDANKTVTATFTEQRWTLTVARIGSGTVTSNPVGIYCGAACTATFTDGTVVTLTATPDAGWSFSGWSGACSGSASTCTVTMDAAKSVTATFTQDPVNYTLTVTRTGTGRGTVTSAPGGIYCGATCSDTYVDGTVVTLTATPASGSSFAGWTGACTGSASTCTVTMNASKSVTATFTEVTWPLTVSRTGSGTVSSAPAGIYCGASCSASYADGTVVALTATPAAGWSFSGWGGACSGTASTCTVTMDAAKTVTATFTQDPVNYTLTVIRTGTGNGTVTSAPAGIYCGAACSATYVDGTVVTLTATPASGSSFAGWTGACTGSASTCTVTMDASKSVTATFTEQRWTLTVARAGTGSGTVTSTPAAIYCGATCSSTFADGTVVTLTATPDTGATFDGWSGACSGTSSTCTITMDASKSVTATFSKAQQRPRARMVGEGTLDANQGRVQFHFAVKDNGDGEVAVELAGRTPMRFESTSVTAVVFSNDPSFAPGGGAVLDTVRFVGTGRYNGRGGYTFVVLATDQGEPGRNDTFQIVIRDSSGAVVASLGGTIRGNNQSILDR